MGNIFSSRIPRYQPVSLPADTSVSLTDCDMASDRVDSAPFPKSKPENPQQEGLDIPRGTTLLCKTKWTIRGTSLAAACMGAAALTTSVPPLCVSLLITAGASFLAGIAVDIYRASDRNAHTLKIFAASTGVSVAKAQTRRDLGILWKFTKEKEKAFNRYNLGADYTKLIGLIADRYSVGLPADDDADNAVKRLRARSGIKAFGTWVTTNINALSLLRNDIGGLRKEVEKHLKISGFLEEQMGESLTNVLNNHLCSGDDFAAEIDTILDDM
jgi:hypothetical protein